MTTTPVWASLDEFAELLGTNGYEVAMRDFESLKPVLLAESPYALVCCFEVQDWVNLSERVFDVQAEMTQLAATAPSPRRWDLYVVVHVLMKAPGPAEETLAETLEADTRYTRKFVRDTIPGDSRTALELALRPLLPLRPVPEFDLVAPDESLRQELYRLDVSQELADGALRAFSETDEVAIP